MNYRNILAQIILLLIAALIILWADGPLDVDDAFITYRYAENLATGQGFVYNAGEQLLGTSTPLYTLLLAAGHALGIPTPPLSGALNFLSALAVVALTMALAQRLSGAHDRTYSAALLAGTYLILQGSFLRYTMAGMETPLYTALILLTFWLVTEMRYTWAAFVAGLTAVMRLDGMAVGGALFLAYLLHERRLPWRALAIYLFTLLPWTLFAFFYFGSPIPQSMLAKQGHTKVYSHSRYWIWEFLFTDHYAVPTTLLALIPVGVVTIYRRYRWSQAWTTVLFWLVAYLIAYTVVGIDFYEWYVVPVYPVLAIFVGVGLYALGAALIQWLCADLRPQIGWVVTVGVLLYGLLPYGRHAYASIIGFQEYLTNVEGPRNAAGRWLQANSAPDDTMYTGAIGHLGYYAERYVYDGAKLVTLPKQLETMQPDYYAIDGGVPDDANCGPMKEFLPPDGAENPPLILSACHQAPIAEIANLTLFNIRIGHYVSKPDRHWTTVDEPLLELQWRVQGMLPVGEWAVYMHYLDAEGNVLAQTDHQLGRHITGYVRPLDNWPEDQRIYTYVALPDDWSTVHTEVVALRLGVWDPTRQEYLPITPLHAEVSLEGGLRIPFHGGNLLVAP